MNYTTELQTKKVFRLYVAETCVQKQKDMVSTLCLDESLGNALGCMQTYRELSTSGMYQSAQWYIKEDGFIVAIAVHDAMLWLENVPPPEYFTPPSRKRLPDIADFCAAGL